MLEPADSSESESYRERQEQETCWLSERCKLMVDVWYGQDGAAPSQTGSGKERHHGPKEQENTKGSYPRQKSPCTR
jgi:hypothetical protein